MGIKQLILIASTSIVFLFPSGGNINPENSPICKPQNFNQNPIPRGTLDSSLRTAGSLKTQIDLKKIPLYFVPNKGQVDKGALFYANTSNYTLWVTKEGLTFDAIGRAVKPENSLSADYKRSGEQKKNLAGIRLERDISRIIFIGANPNRIVIPVEETDHRVNYFVGDNPSFWRSNIQTSKAILYKEIYKNIDLKIYGSESQIEYDWIVKPGGEVESICFAYQGVERATISPDGALGVQTKFGELLHNKPDCYQVINNKKISVKGVFQVLRENLYRFKVEGFNPAYELIIDPLVYSTFFGGSESDQSGLAIAIDKNKCMYITGVVYSRDFPLKNPYQKKLGFPYLSDIFIAKFSADGQSLVYSTFLGGKYEDKGKGIRVDINGSAYVTGYTLSFDFPVRNAYQASHKGTFGDVDAFLTKIAPDGSSLIYSTYFGGEANEITHDIVINSELSAYIVGRTNSTDLPLTNAFEKKYSGVSDAFITKFSQDGKSLLFSTYYGGSGWEEALGVDLDKEGCVYITGYTDSINLPTRKEYCAKLAGVCDAFIAKFSHDGSSLVYATYLGGSDTDRAYDIAVDAKGYAYIAGCTYSRDFPTRNPFLPRYSWEGDAFVTKLSRTGEAIIYSTYLGGNGWDSASGLAVDDSGNACITGFTYSTNFPLRNAFQERLAEQADVFISMLSSQGQKMLFSSYLGGENLEKACGIVLDKKGIIYLAGYTNSAYFPTVDPYEEQKIGSLGIFIAKISPLEGDVLHYPRSTLSSRRNIKTIEEKSGHDLHESSSSNQKTRLFSYSAQRLIQSDFRGKTHNGDATEVFACFSALGDIDRDGDLDLIVAGTWADLGIGSHSSGFGGATEIIIFINDGRGNFIDRTDQLLVPIAYWESFMKIDLGDIDRDGDLDLLLSSAGAEYNEPVIQGDRDRILINNGKGYFSDRSYWRYKDDFHSGTYFIGFSDLDGDKDLDIYDGDSNFTDRIWLNNGRGYFSIDSRNDFQFRSQGVSFGDLDNDGDMDVVGAGGGSDEIILLQNQGRGVFKRILNGPKNIPGGWGWDPEVADFNGDGLKDIFIANSGFYKKDQLFFNKGNFIFEEVTDNLHQGKPPEGSKYAASGDIDNDGDIDIFVSVVSSDHARFYENLGKGEFRESSGKIPELRIVEEEIQLGDFDKDGDMDLFLGTFFTSKILINELKPTFNPPKNFAVLRKDENWLALTWEANPEHKNIAFYNIYNIQDGKRKKLGSVDANHLEFHYKELANSLSNRFAITAVNKAGKESNPAYAIGQYAPDL